MMMCLWIGEAKLAMRLPSLQGFVTDQSKAAHLSQILIEMSIAGKHDGSMLLYEECFASRQGTKPGYTVFNP